MVTNAAKRAKVRVEVVLRQLLMLLIYHLLRSGKLDRQSVNLSYCILVLGSGAGHGRRVDALVAGILTELIPGTNTKRVFAKEIVKSTKNQLPYHNDSLVDPVHGVRLALQGWRSLAMSTCVQWPTVLARPLVRAKDCSAKCPVKWRGNFS